jgi:DNA (cytosine-5)-methyltransferase 1
MAGPRKADSTKRDPKISVVDLFCGAGGLAYGLRSAGLHIAAGIDVDPACRFPFEANCQGIFRRKSVSRVTKDELVALFRGADVRVLAGCAPCQPFSTYSQARKSPDRRWTLLRAFGKLATAVKPEIVTMENVRGLATNPIWNEFITALRNADYYISWAEARCVDYGVPQTRLRLVLLASRLGPIQIPKPEKLAVPSTVRNAIAGLPRLEAGQSSADDPLHSACRLSPLNLRRIQASVPGGTWRDWPEELRATCHLKATGETYPSVYGRMEWDQPSPTITTQCFGFGNGRFGHPEQNRAITLREAAILQSFPPEYKFVASRDRTTFAKVGKLIGNAVPPKLAEAIGRSIRAHVATNASGRSRRQAVES